MQNETRIVIFPSLVVGSLHPGRVLYIVRIGGGGGTRQQTCYWNTMVAINGELCRNISGRQSTATRHHCSSEVQGARPLSFFRADAPLSTNIAKVNRDVRDKTATRIPPLRIQYSTYRCGSFERSPTHPNSSVYIIPNMGKL